MGERKDGWNGGRGVRERVGGGGRARGKEAQEEVCVGGPGVYERYIGTALAVLVCTLNMMYSLDPCSSPIWSSVPESSLVVRERPILFRAVT